MARFVVLGEGFGSAALCCAVDFRGWGVGGGGSLQVSFSVWLFGWFVALVSIFFLFTLFRRLVLLLSGGFSLGFVGCCWTLRAMELVERGRAGLRGALLS